MNDTIMTILLMSLTGSVLAIVLFLLKPITRNHVSKAFLYYIWLPVLLRLIVPFGFAINVAYETPTAPSITPASAESVEPALTIPIPENAVPVLPGDTSGPFTVTVTAPETQTPSIVEAAPATGTGAAPKTEEKFDFVQFLLDNLGYIWLTGAVSSLGWYLVSYAVFYRRLSRSFESPSMADLDVFNSMRRTGNVRLIASAETKTPMHMGAFRPVIVLPQIDYAANGMEKELRDVLRHELTHWRRHDIFYKWLAVLVQSVHWFNPIVYFIRREIDKNCELSCDEAVVRGLSQQDRISYGNTLLALASERAIPMRIPATTLSEGKKQLKERIISIRDYKKSSRTMAALMLVMAIALTGYATAIATVGKDMTDGKETVPVSGWLYGDDAVLAYVMKQYDIDGKKIVNGTYQETGRRDGGDYKRYTAGTEDGETYLLTAHGELKTHYFLFQKTGQRGPEFRVTGISFTAIPPYSTVPAPPVSDSPLMAIQEVLLGERSFVSDSGETLTIDELGRAISSTPDYMATVTEFCIVDLDGDSTPEAVLSVNGIGSLILHAEDGGEVRGYTKYIRQFNDLRADGTFASSSSARGITIGGMNFNGDTAEQRIVIACLPGTDLTDNYYVDGKLATEEEYESALAEWMQQPYPAWYDFNFENISNNSGSQNSNSDIGASDKEESSPGQIDKAAEYTGTHKWPYAQEEYEYKTKDDGSITITKYLGAGGDVVIPSELDGKPVTAIGYNDDFNGAFQDCVELTSVTIPDGVTDIEDNAFRDCTALTTVTVPASVRVIWNCAFSDCTSLEAIYFEGDAPEFANYVFGLSEPVLYYHEGASGWTNPFYWRVTSVY